MAPPSEDQTTAKGGDSDEWVTESGSSEQDKQETRPAPRYIPQTLVDCKQAQFSLVISADCWGVWCQDTEVFANLSYVDERHVPDLPRMSTIKKDLPKTSKRNTIARLCRRMHKGAYLSGGCHTQSTGKCWMQHDVKTFTDYAKSLTLAAAGYKGFNWDGSWLSDVEKAGVLWLKPNSEHQLDPTALTDPGVTRDHLQESRPNYEQTDATTADLGCDRSL